MRGIIIAIMLLAVTPVSAQEGWEFKPAQHGYLFGPGFWVEEGTATLSVSCTRGTPHIIWPDVDSILRDSPELLPESFEFMSPGTHETFRSPQQLSLEPQGI